MPRARESSPRDRVEGQKGTRWDPVALFTIAPVPLATLVTLVGAESLVILFFCAGI